MGRRLQPWTEQRWRLTQARCAAQLREVVFRGSDGAHPGKRSSGIDFLLRLSSRLAGQFGQLLTPTWRRSFGGSFPNDLPPLSKPRSEFTIEFLPLATEGQEQGAVALLHKIDCLFTFASANDVLDALGPLRPTLDRLSHMRAG
jgi:hypothetical protein